VQLRLLAPVGIPAVVCYPGVGSWKPARSGRQRPL